MSSVNLYMPPAGDYWDQTDWQKHWNFKEATPSSLLLEMLGDQAVLKLTVCEIAKHHLGFPGGSDGKESPAMQDTRIPWIFSPGEGNGYPLQHSCLENSTDRRTWQAILFGVVRVGHDLATNTHTKHRLNPFFFFQLGRTRLKPKNKT